jgi:hypothetical protein
MPFHFLLAQEAMAVLSLAWHPEDPNYNTNKQESQKDENEFDLFFDGASMQTQSSGAALAWPGGLCASLRETQPVMGSADSAGPLLGSCAVSLEKEFILSSPLSVPVSLTQ